ncbi:MAG: peptide chain release factor-like protein [Roseiflexaceae bacterium]|nr:peptide chain release factor-like protein [Roseiflexaceae bacterium]
MTTDAPLRHPTDRESLERDSTMTFFTAGGPGGQHRNKVATGVRLTHEPSGVVVTATERRSQSANREMAFDRLAARLEAAQRVVAPRYATRPGRAAVARRRSEKERTAARKRERRQRPSQE